MIKTDVLDSNKFWSRRRSDQLAALLECGIYLEFVEEDLSKSIRISAVLSRAASEHIDNALLDDADTYHRKRKTAKMLDRKNTWLGDNVIRTESGEGVIISDDDTLPLGNSVSRPGDTSVDYDDDGNLIVNLSPQERNYNVDVAAAMNRGAYTVTQNCPLSKAYSLFTALGLRHLPVLGKDGTVVGMLSRANFLPEHIEKHTGIEMHHSNQDHDHRNAHCQH